MYTARSFSYAGGDLCLGDLPDRDPLGQRSPGQRPSPGRDHPLYRDLLDRDPLDRDRDPPHLWTDKHLWKQNLGKLRLRVVIMRYQQL